MTAIRAVFWAIIQASDQNPLRRLGCMRTLLRLAIILVLGINALCCTGQGVRPGTSAAPALAGTETAAMATQVRAEFLHAWNAYKQYAWGHDELKPLSQQHRDWYGTSLYVTAVDSLDTMILMGLNTEADDAREMITQNLSFDKDIEVKDFEITIRLLG